MKISVIVPTYFKHSHENVLASILRQKYEDFEIIIVRNGGNRNTYYHKNKLKIYEIAESGANNARNFGIKVSKGEVVAFIDDDAIAPSDWLLSIEKSHIEFQAPVIGGRVLPKWPNSKKPNWVKGILLDYLSILDKPSNTPVIVGQYDWLVATNISFKKFIFRKVGLFDKNFGRNKEYLLSADEVELCHRVREKGYEIIFDPKIVVRHVIPSARLTPQYFIDRAYWQGVSDFLMDNKYLTKDILTDKFEELNSQIQYTKLDPNNVFKSVNQLCVYARNTGYLQAYIKYLVIKRKK